VARVLQSRFDRREKDTKPASGISIEIRSRRQRSVETASVSSKSHIVSSKISSWRRPNRGRRAFGGEVRAKDLVINIDDKFPRDEVLPEFGTWRCNLRPRFPPH